MRHYDWTRRATLAATLLAMTGGRAMAASGQKIEVPGGLVREVISRSGQAYRIQLWRPEGEAPKAGYQVAYLLDGDAVFGTAVDIARLRALGFGLNPRPPGMIVAIGYPAGRPFDMTRRTLDYTPPAEGVDLPARYDGQSWPPSGGADRFLDFIEQELKPLVAAEFPVDPARSALLGHSFGGLFALHCLFTRPDAFATYVAASPSIWWNKGAILGTERAFTARGGPGRPTRVLLTVGSQEQPSDSQLLSVHEERLRAARMVDNAREMAERLGTLAHLKVSFQLFDGEDHGWVIPASVARGLRFAIES